MPLVYKSVGNTDVRWAINRIVAIVLSFLGCMSPILRALPVVSGRMVSGARGRTCFQESRMSECLIPKLCD